MELLTGTIHRLERAAGTRIVVRAGRVWLTETGQTDDVFLGAGESHVTAGSGRVLIESLGAPDRDCAVVELVATTGAHRAVRGTTGRLPSWLAWWPARQRT